jgi:hypothetical protein
MARPAYCLILERGGVDETAVDTALTQQRLRTRRVVALDRLNHPGHQPFDRARGVGAVEGDLMGGPRYEQLFRATGAVRVGGVEYSFTGSGLRIRRQGVRRLEGFWGHCWQSAPFVSGRAFGYIAYPPHPDGQPTFNEGYLFDGDGDLIPARVVQAPWLTTLQPLGEDVSVVLETAGRTVHIEGETVVSTHDITDPSEIPADQLAKLANWTFPALQQAGVRYRWDGEETYGMLERSSPMDKLRP